MLTPELIADLKAKHGALLLLEADGFEIVVRSVDLAAWRNFRRRVISPTESSQAAEELLFEVLAHPEPAELRRYFDAKPLAVELLCNHLCREAGSLSTWTTRSTGADGHEELTCEDLRVVIQPISGTVGRMYQRRLEDTTLASGAAEWLLQQALVSPSWSELLDQIKGRPFVLDRLAILISERAGKAVEVRTKKL